jgi:hypothetical protein
MLEVTQLSIVIATESNNPSILNPDFLKYNGIVSDDWQSADRTVTTGVISQVTYENGVSIVSEPNKINFVERIGDGDYGSLQVPAIAQKYIETLPHVKYTAIGNNPIGHSSCTSLDEARDFSKKLVAPGPWFDIGSGLQESSIQLVYSLDDGHFILSVEPADNPREEEEGAVIVFAANFHREITGSNSEERLTSALRIIGDWKDDIAFYEKAVNDSFLVGEK